MHFVAEWTARRGFKALIGATGNHVTIRLFCQPMNTLTGSLAGVWQVPPVGLSSRVPPAGLGMQMRPLSLGAILTQLFICRCRDFFWSGSQLNVSARSRLLVQMDSLSGGDERKDAPLLLAAQLVSPKTGPMNDVA